MAFTRQKLPPFGGAGRSESVNEKFMQDWCRTAWAFGGELSAAGACCIWCGHEKRRSALWQLRLF